VVKGLLVARQRCESIRPVGEQDVSGQKHFGREFAPAVTRQGSPVLPVLMGHFSRAHLVTFRKCRRGSGA
jgi:hypothetical protein